MIKHPRIRGFKCYHQSSVTKGPTFLSDVEEYLPETAWQVAEEREMSITIHMVKPHALADEKNMAYFKAMTAKYPHAKLILAHCARGFASWTTVQPVRELRGIPNIYYDMGAICDPATIFELIRQAGPEHVMWGTDYFIDRAHGKPVNCGESFRWLYTHELPDSVNFPVCKTVLEALFAFWQASLMLDMTKSDIEQVFYKTGTDLFGLKD
jgi:glutamate-1-semialdehyde 2,1-aminomutase